MRRNPSTAVNVALIGGVGLSAFLVYRYYQSQQVVLLPGQPVKKLSFTELLTGTVTSLLAQRQAAKDEETAKAVRYVYDFAGGCYDTVTKKAVAANLCKPVKLGTAGTLGALGGLGSLG